MRTLIVVCGLSTSALVGSGQELLLDACPEREPAAPEALSGDVLIDVLPNPATGETQLVVVVDEANVRPLDGKADRVYVLQTIDPLERFQTGHYSDVTVQFTERSLRVERPGSFEPILWLTIDHPSNPTTVNVVRGFGLSRRSNLDDDVWQLSAAGLTAAQAESLDGCEAFPETCDAGGPGAIECDVGGCGGEPDQCDVSCGEGYACCWCRGIINEGACCKCAFPS